MKFGVAEFCHERTIDEGIYIRKDLAHTRVRLDLLVCESGIAPDVLACLLLDAACEFGKGFDLIERVTAGEGHVRELVGLDDLEKFINGHFPTALEIPGLRVMTAGTMVGTSRTINGCAEARPIGHRLFQYVQYPYLHRGFVLLSGAGRTSSHERMASYASREP